MACQGWLAGVPMTACVCRAQLCAASTNTAPEEWFRSNLGSQRVEVDGGVFGEAKNRFHIFSFKTKKGLLKIATPSLQL